jgi:hypothetical protein
MLGQVISGYVKLGQVSVQFRLSAFVRLVQINSVKVRLGQVWSGYIMVRTG